MLTSELLLEEPELIDLIDKFISRLPIMRNKILDSHKDKKNNELPGLIHQMKGVAGNYGYPTLTELCEKIEFQIENEDSNKIAELITELDKMVDQVIAGYEANHKIALMNG